MSLIHEKNMGGQNYREEVELAAVSVTKDTVLYNVSGYASNATVGNITTGNIIGVVQESVDNSGGSVGDLSAIIEMSPLALYIADTTAAMTAAVRWTNVTLDSVGVVDENDAKTDKDGIIKLRGLAGEEAVTKKALVSLNFAPPTDA